jgi:hypothetical protein
MPKKERVALLHRDLSSSSAGGRVEQLMDWDAKRKKKVETARLEAKIRARGEITGTPQLPSAAKRAECASLLPPAHGCRSRGLPITGRGWHRSTAASFFSKSARVGQHRRSRASSAPRDAGRTTAEMIARMELGGVQFGVNCSRWAPPLVITTAIRCSSYEVLTKCECSPLDGPGERRRAPPQRCPAQGC